jgi:hypothetical protein
MLDDSGKRPLTPSSPEATLRTREHEVNFLPAGSPTLHGNLNQVISKAFCNNFAGEKICVSSS